jgi:hypothetical protein
MSIRIRLAALCCLVVPCGVAGAGCVRIDGGAVEISWVVRSSDGRAITDCTCSAPRIAFVRLNLTGVGGDIDGTTPCAGKPECQFPCHRQTGSTPFEVQEGTPSADVTQPQYEISVTALDDAGAELPDVETPAPILRTVVRGRPTEVDAFLLVAQCADECSGMNSSGVCTRP